MMALRRTWQAKRERLARASRGNADDIAAGKQHRPALRLNHRGLLEAFGACHEGVVHRRFSKRQNWLVLNVVYSEAVVLAPLGNLSAAPSASVFVLLYQYSK